MPSREAGEGTTPHGGLPSCYSSLPSSPAPSQVSEICRAGRSREAGEGTTPHGGLPSCYSSLPSSPALSQVSDICSVGKVDKPLLELDRTKCYLNRERLLTREIYIEISVAELKRRP